MGSVYTDDMALRSSPFRRLTSVSRSFSCRSLSSRGRRPNLGASLLYRERCSVTDHSWISGSIRRRSKADNVDLREGDILVATNGVAVQGKTHSQTMDSIDEAGDWLTLDIIRPAEGGPVSIQTIHHSSTETRSFGDSNVTTRTDTVQETRPDGSHSTTTTVTRQHSSMPLVQNTTPKPFIASGPSILDTDVSDGSVNLTIGEKENVPPQPMFKVKNIAAESQRSDSPARSFGSSQDPYVDEMLSVNQEVCMSMERPEYDEEGFGMAVPKVMPATPGLPAVDIQKLLEPSDEPDTQSQRTMRTCVNEESKSDLKSDSEEPEAENPILKKLYADSSFFDDPDAKYPTIQEQVKMAHQVAKLLMSEAAIQKSKGSKMFSKRRERAEKWVHEAKPEDQKPGQRPLAGAVTHKPPPEAFYKSLQTQNQIGIWNPMTAAPPPQAPPPPPVITPTQPINYLQPPQDQICEHAVVAPEKCFNLAAALHASKGRGGQIFAKRRAKSESWVIDENNVKAPPPPIVNPVVHRPKTAKPAVRYEKSPWEAALDTGRVDDAFQQANKRHTVGPGVFKNLPDMSSTSSWTPDQYKKIHDFKAGAKEKKNFKDFNVRARGWGGGGGPTSDEDDRRSVSSITSADSGSIDRRALPRMAAGNRRSMGYDPRQPAVGQSDLAAALGARGFVAVGNSGASDL